MVVSGEDRLVGTDAGICKSSADAWVVSSSRQQAIIVVVSALLVARTVSCLM